MSISKDQVFIIDSHSGSREVLRECLKGEEYAFFDFDSAETFLHTVQTEPYGCLIVDVDLDGMNGAELQSELSKREWTIPQIYLSDIGQFDQIIAIVQNGAFMVLRNPVQAVELRSTVREAMVKLRQTQIQKDNYLSMQEQVASLSEVEKQVLELLMDGNLNKMIASKLDIGLRSVVRFRRSILSKLQTDSIPSLIRKLYEAALFPVSTKKVELNKILDVFEPRQAESYS